MGDYIKPTQAYKKLEAAKLLRQSVYIYAAPGYGKTELIHQYFRNKKYIFGAILGILLLIVMIGVNI